MKTQPPFSSMFSSADDVCIEEFDQLCKSKITRSEYPLSSKIEKNILIYDGDELRTAIEQNQHTDYQCEMALGLSTGCGVLVIENFYADLSDVDRMSKVFDDLFANQNQRGEVSDHFAKAGDNGRIWNAFQKSAFQSPVDFIQYYKNPLLQLVCEAWLGPHYQLTAQVNVVHPGGQAQHAHRDYHLGFQENDEVVRYPVHAQLMSQYLTLQGAVAHCDMPIESGPTMLLPFSQQYPLGYLAWRNDDFKQYFKENAVQLPLKKGDAVFFNPALFHAAGCNNSSQIHRIANLLQISTALAKPMENIDLYQLISTIYPALLDMAAEMTTAELDAILMGACDGYSFPSNLDTDPPLNGMAPMTMEQLTHNALTDRIAPEQFDQQLKAHFKKRQP